MIGLEELYNWILLNFLWIGIYLLVLERIFWEFQPRSGEILTKVKNLITYKIGVFLFLLGCLIVFSTFITETKGIWIYGENGWSGESTRSVILALGALGALYGLALANERLYIGGANLFNDRLSRAIEAIGHESLTIRNSGLRLLHNLGKEAQKNGQADSDDHKLIVKILHGYIRDRAILPEKPKNGSLPEPEESKERVDIVLGIELLFELVPPAERDEVTLDNLDFRGLIFNLKQDLQNVNLGDANLEGANLGDANLQDAELWGASLREAKLGDADLKGTKLNNADISKARFPKVKNLTQEQLNASLYEKGKPPKDLLRGGKVPEDCAYEWEVLIGQMCRRLVQNGKWIDTFTPWWYEGDEDENENEET